MSVRGNIFNSDSSDSDSDSPIFNLPNLPIVSKNNNSFDFETEINKIISTMATPQVPVLKTEYLNMVPEFNGETELLPRFIEISEKLVRKFYNSVDVTDFQNEYLMSSLLAKIKGTAALNISSCAVRTWDDLKTALLNAYSDKRDVYTLTIEMADMKQSNTESPFEFYNRVQQFLNLQISYVASHIVDQNERAVIAQFCRNLSLRVLLRGLKDPIGPLMRTKNPIDMNQALHMLTNDFQIESSNLNNYPRNRAPLRLPVRQPFRPRQPSNFIPNFNYPRPPLPAITYPQTQRPLNNFQRPPFQRNYFSNNAGPSTNVFRPNLNRNLPKPTPMSISTRNTQQPSRQNQYQPNRNFRPDYSIEEVFNIENQPVPTVEHPVEEQNFENSQNFENTQNFRELASENPPFPTSN